MTDSIPKLGRVEIVDLRSVWASEPMSFTPWLALPDNLALLADAIGVPGLDHVATERAVSEFSVDIVAKVAGTDDLVAIENQLESSDHTHLGQCMTYAAGTEAKIVVWVVKQFKEGHRAALDWLNRKTTEDVAFFGVEVSAIRIGDSLPAPQFDVVVKPNDWARSVRDQATASDNSAERAANTAYWNAFDVFANARNVKHGMAQQGRGTNYYHYIGGNKKNAITAYVARYSNTVGAYVATWTPDSRAIYEKLKASKEEIEKEFGGPLRWSATNATIDLKPANPDNQSDWPRQHQWLADSMARLKSVFEPRLAALGAFESLNTPNPE